MQHNTIYYCPALTSILIPLCPDDVMCVCLDGCMYACMHVICLDTTWYLFDHRTTPPPPPKLQR